MEGLLYGPLFENGAIKVLIFNPDGSEIEESGNGVRIFAKYLRDYQYVTEQKFVLATKARNVEVEFLDEEGNRMRVNMGKADFMAVSIPADGFFDEIVNMPLMFHGILYNTTCLSVGNPNCVIMTEDVSCKTAKALGPYVENASYFPERMNLQLCKVESRLRA